MKKGLVITPEDFNGVDWIAKMKELGLNTVFLFRQASYLLI